jgi:hypothetical protein
VGSCVASVWYGRRNPAKQLVQVLGPARAHLAGRPPEHGLMNSLVRSTPGATVDDEVIAEHFTRNRQFFGMPPPFTRPPSESLLIFARRVLSTTLRGVDDLLIRALYFVSRAVTSNL